MLLNCFPRLVASRNVPSGRSTVGGSTTEKCALPSEVGNFQSQQRCLPPYWIASPAFRSRWMPS
jgi:hypothetical protein